MYNYHTFDIKDMVLGLFHHYGNVGCDRWSPEGQSENRVKNSSLWKVTIPHPKYSGRCFTYRYMLNVQIKQITQSIIFICPLCFFKCLFSFQRNSYFSPPVPSSPGNCESVRSNNSHAYKKHLL